MAEIFTTTENVVEAGKKKSYLITQKRSVHYATPHFTDQKKGWTEGERQKTKIVPMTDGRLMVFFDRFTGKTGYKVCKDMDEVRSLFSLEEGVEVISRTELK